jgi:hypothetical protein
MKRDSLASKLDRQRLLGKVLHECWNCHAVGLEPGDLATHLRDYGTRDWLAGRYDELALSPDGLCAECEKQDRSRGQ